uniref:IspD/TarI family cytidylyltransferase n=1 Tax=Roseicyclus sp. TaxID=1914329 RepID=UPI003F6CB2E0
MVDRPAYARPKIAALIVAAGKGVRAGGDLPKQWRRIAGKTIAQHTVNAFDAHPAIDMIMLVVAQNSDRADWPVTTQKTLKTATGGATRAASVLAGLEALEGQADLVLIHDVARPGIPAHVIDAVIGALAQHQAAAPALAVTDALWRGDAMVTGTVDRTGLWRAQTPQGFH